MSLTAQNLRTVLVTVAVCLVFAAALIRVLAFGAISATAALMGNTD